MVAALLLSGAEQPEQARAQVAGGVLRFNIALHLEEDQLTTNLGHRRFSCGEEREAGSKESFVLRGYKQP